MSVDSRGFSVSPLNAMVRVEGPSVPPILHDTTLREGMQAAPVSFSDAEKVEVALLLDQLGISQIQVGYGLEDRRVIAELKDRGIRAKLSVLIPVFKTDWRERLDTAAEAGADIFLMLYRASDEQLALLNKSREQACKDLAQAVADARSLNPTSVAGNASFATMADPTFVVELLSSAYAAGADRLGIADSTGITGPKGISYLVRSLKAAVPDAAVSVHMHNDFGLAVANSIAAWQAGASIADVSVLGLGERAGNAALEQMVMALEGVYGVETGFQLSRISEVIHRISQIAHVPIPSTQAVVGEDVFSQKLEMHVQVTASHPHLHEPFDPKVIGSRRRLRLGSGSGVAAITAKLAELGLDIGSADAEDLVAWVNRTAVDSKSSVTDDDFFEFAVSVGAVPAGGDL